MSKPASYQIPFDSEGNQLHYPDTWGRYGVKEWRDNHEFEGTLRVVNMARGRSAAYFIAEVVETGKRVTLFMKDLFDAIPFIERGLIRGRFTFQKRGMNYGIRCVKLT